MKLSSSLFYSLIGIALLAPTFAYAQGDVRNGGDLTEAALKIYVNRIADFVDSKTGKETFPEVAATNLSAIARAITPRLTNDEVRDSFGNVRTCVNQKDPYRITCNTKLISNNDQTGPAIYVTLFHELLNLVDLELPKGKDDPSIYPTSSKLASFAELKVQYDWVLNQKQQGFEQLDFNHAYITCRAADIDSYFSPMGKTQAPTLIMKDGNFWLFTYGEPSSWSKYSQQSTDPRDYVKWEREKKLKRLIGSHPRLTLLASGKMNLEYLRRGVVGRYDSGDKNKHGYPTQVFVFQTYANLQELIANHLDDNASEDFPLTYQFGEAIGTFSHDPSKRIFNVDGHVNNLTCNYGTFGISQTRDLERLLKEESLKNGNVPFNEN